VESVDEFVYLGSNSARMMVTVVLLYYDESDWRHLSCTLSIGYGSVAASVLKQSYICIKL